MKYLEFLALIILGVWVALENILVILAIRNRSLRGKHALQLGDLAVIV